MSAARAAKARRMNIRNRRALTLIRTEGVVIDMSERRPVVHEPARIWGSPAGRVITCECGEQLRVTWDAVSEVMAEHIAAQTGGAA